MALQAVRDNLTSGEAILEHYNKIISQHHITDTGKILVHGRRDTAKRYRRKLKTFVHKIHARTMSYEDLWASTQSTFNYYQRTNDHGRLLALRRLFYKTFGFSAESFDNFATRDREAHYYDTELRLPCEL